MNLDKRIVGKDGERPRMDQQRHSRAVATLVYATIPAGSASISVS